MKRCLRPHLTHRLSQNADIARQKVAPTVIQIDREEICPTSNPVPPIICHDRIRLDKANIINAYKKRWVALRSPILRLLVREIETLRAAIRAVRLATPFHTDAWVVLPDHMHCIWTLPEEDTNYSGRWRAIKKRFSKALPNLELRRPEVLAREGRGIWQKRFWEHTIRDDRDYRAHMDYVHFNPVKHGLVAHPAEWPYSTFKKCVELGLYDAAWSKPDHTTTPSDMGERP